MSNELQPFTYERKKPGDPIRSRDWNAAMQAITDLGNALRSKPNGIPAGPLTVQGTVNATRFVGDGSGLTGIATGGHSQWTDGANGAIHYHGGNVGIGTTQANEKLEVNGTVRATRFVGDGSGLTGIQNTDGNQWVNAPTHPQRVGQWAAQQGAVNSVYVAGKYAYLAVDNIGLAIVDISDPANPRQVGEGGYASLYTRGVHVAGRYAYLATTQMGLDIFDIGNVSIPQQVGAVNLQATTSAIYVSGPYAYLATSDQGLQIVDISDPTAPKKIGQGAAIGAAQDVYVAGIYAYLATSDRGLQIVDISEPANPQPVGTGVSTIGSAQGVYVVGQYAYVATSDQGLQLVDISDPAAPQRIGQGATAIGSAQGVYVAGDYAYVAASDNGLQIIRIAQPIVPKFQPGSSGMDWNEDRTQAWAWASPGVMVDEPSQLSGGSSIGNIGSAQAVFVAGRYAYVVAGASGLQIIDLQGNDIFAANIGTVATNSLSVSENASVDNNLSVRNGLNVGPGGVKSDGTVTAVRFVGDGSGLTGIQGVGGGGPWLDKADGTGIVYRVGANVTIGAANSGTSLQILNRNQDATGDTVILGRSEGSHLRMGYHTDYSWLQSSAGRPLLLNPIENNVGIGTTTIYNPQGWNKVVDIVGAAHARLNVRSATGVITSVFSHDDWSGARGVIGTDSNHALSLATQYELRMTIDTAGNVGIGTTEPTHALHVATGKSVRHELGPNQKLSLGGNGTFEVDTPNVVGGRFVVAENGNVGIGASRPSEKLEVDGTIKATKFVGDGSGLTGLPTGAASQWASAANGVIHYAGGNVGIGAPIPASRLHIDNGRVDITTSEDNGGGQNRFSGLTAWNGQTAYRRAQLVISSSYSDLVIASSKSNHNHGSTLTFATSNPDDTTQYRKWVINQGNWGDRKQFLDFGYGDANGRANPHDNINGTETVLTLDGVNKRVGIGATSPSAKLEVAGVVIVTALKIGTGVQVDRFDDGALGNSSSTIPTAKAVTAYVDAQIAQLKRVFDRHQHKYVHFTYGDILNVNIQNVSDTSVPNPT